MKRNDTHDYEDNIQIRIIGEFVMISRGKEIVAIDQIISTTNPKARKTADLYYKKHILETYDDANEIKTPYKGYFPEYSPEPGQMIRVVSVEIAHFDTRKKLVSCYPPFKDKWVPRGERVTSVIREIWQ